MGSGEISWQPEKIKALLTMNLIVMYRTENLILVSMS